MNDSERLMRLIDGFVATSSVRRREARDRRCSAKGPSQRPSSRPRPVRSGRPTPSAARPRRRGGLRRARRWTFRARSARRGAPPVARCGDRSRRGVLRLGRRPFRSRDAGRRAVRAHPQRRGSSITSANIPVARRHSRGRWPVGPSWRLRRSLPRTTSRGSRRSSTSAAAGACSLPRFSKRTPRPRHASRSPRRDPRRTRVPRRSGTRRSGRVHRR